MDPQASPDWEGLRALCRRLRAPDGCSWDRAQTLSSLSPYLLEETHEVLEALAAGEDARLMEEIGDLLFLLAFLVTIAEEEQRFSSAELVRATLAKMIRRHPHVFAQASADDPQQAGEQWERIKAEERRARGAGRDRLDSGAPGLPALLEAFRVQEKAAGAGFDWPDARGVLEKLDEERQELAAAMAEAPAEVGPGRPAAVSRAVHEEIGDLLFTLVNLARHLGADPEQLLKGSTRKFRERFARMEALLASDGVALGEADLEAMERAWQRGKADAANERPPA